MSVYIAALIGAGAVFLTLNLVWIGVIAQGFYQRQMGMLMAPSFNLAAVSAFYPIYLCGLIFFAVAPGLAAESLAVAGLHGALFGFICYATYDLTNLAVLRQYPARLAIVDILAGTTVTAAAALAGFLSAQLL